MKHQKININISNIGLMKNQQKSTKINEQIWHLRDHNEKLLSQIEYSKVKKQILKQENDSSDKELQENLS